MKVVFDTNVVVAGIVAEGLCPEILEIHLPEHDVSGDADLLTLSTYSGIELLSPRQFVGRQTPSPRR